MTADVADYIVLRAPTVPGFDREGWWMDLRDVPPKPPEATGRAVLFDPQGRAYVAAPTGTFEVREDGAVAEVWEVTSA